MKNEATKRKNRWILLAALWLIALSGSGFAKNIFNWRMVNYPDLRIQSQVLMDSTVLVLDEMKRQGFNGIFVDGAWTQRLHLSSVAAHRPRLNAFLAQAKKRGIFVSPTSQGQAGNLLMDQNLREALPVKGTPFVVSGGVATAKGDPSVRLVNSDFEQPLNNGWRLYGPFKTVPETRPGSTGKSGVRLDDPTQMDRRLVQRITVKPFRVYELSVWAKIRYESQIGKEMNTAGTYFVVQGSNPPTLLKTRYFRGIKANSTWQQIRQKFNSLQNTTVTISLHATDYWRWNGAVWFDDAAIREVGLYQTTKNPSFTVKVRKVGGAALKVGKDFVVGNQKLTIPAGSTTKDGDELLVDWGTTANVLEAKPEAVFCYDNVWNAVRKQIASEDEWFDTPKMRTYRYSEWRLAGWDPQCISQYNIANLGSGPYTAGTANKTAAIYREANSNRVSVLYHDDYSPYHNSGASHGAINGGNLGNGHLLDTSLIVFVWGFTGPGAYKSMLYWAGLDKTSHGKFGVKTSRHRQYLSSNGKAQTATALKYLADAEKAGMKDGDVIGIGIQMYARGPGWFLKNMAPMATACKAVGRWGTGPIDLPPASVNPVAKPQTVGGLSLKAVSHSRQGVRRFQFEVPDNRNVEFSVFDLHGKRIAMLLNEQMAANTYQRELDVSKLTSGMYLVSLCAAGKDVRRITKKMIVF